MKNLKREGLAFESSLPVRLQKEEVEDMNIGH